MDALQLPGFGGYLLSDRGYPGRWHWFTSSGGTMNPVFYSIYDMKILFHFLNRKYRSIVKLSQNLPVLCISL